MKYMFAAIVFLTCNAAVCMAGVELPRSATSGVSHTKMDSDSGRFSPSTDSPGINSDVSLSGETRGSGSLSSGGSSETLTGLQSNIPLEQTIRSGTSGSSSETLSGFGDNRPLRSTMRQ